AAEPLVDGIVDRWIQRVRTLVAAMPGGHPGLDVSVSGFGGNADRIENRDLALAEPDQAAVGELPDGDAVTAGSGPARWPRRAAARRRPVTAGQARIFRAVLNWPLMVCWMAMCRNPMASSSRARRSGPTSIGCRPPASTSSARVL